MNRDKELVDLFIKKNFIIDISKSSKVLLKELYSLYENWAKSLNIKISKSDFLKYMEELGNKIYISQGYKCFKVIYKTTGEQLTEDEIKKFQKPNIIDIENKEFDIYEFKPKIIIKTKKKSHSRHRNIIEKYKV